MDYNDKINTDEIINNLQIAADIHNKVRKECHKNLKSGQKYYDIVKLYENEIKKYSTDTIDIAFPIGFSVNNICAHDSSYKGDNRVLNKGDIVKIDFGVHSNGYIIDSAYTHVVDNLNNLNNLNNVNIKTQNLINSTIEATNIVIKNSGVDARLYELSELIEETISSYDGIKPIYAIGGHNILKNKIHGGKLILGKPHPSQEGIKMEENEIFAIETFASTGTGDLKIMPNVTHYMQKNNDDKSMNLLKNIKCGSYIKSRNMLPFNMDWIDNLNKRELELLTKMNIIEAYPALADIKDNALTSQSEHTIFIKESCVINLSEF
jgi:methionyl aminopeptidase